MKNIAENPFKIAIVGGGIGGLFAALSLHHYCKHDNIEIDVYEQATQYAEIGAGVGLGVNAAKLLHRLGLGDAMNAIAGDRNGVWISFRRYDDGAEILTVPADDTQTIRQLPVHRAEFLELLHRAVKERGAAKMHTDKRCNSIEEDGEIMRVKFEDGTNILANLIISCDGIHSKIRSHFISDKPTYSGRIAYRGLVAIDQIETWWPLKSYSASWLGKGKHFLVYPISRNRTLNIVAFASVPEESIGGLKESWTATSERRELEEDFADFDETVRRVIGCMPEKPSKWLLNDREPLARWVWASGKVVLMGDAAHAMLPHQGAGAGQALEDGYILGRAIHDHLASGRGELERWAYLYQAVRLPRAQKVQRTSREAGDVYEMQADGLSQLSFDQCVPIVREKLKDRMKWVWSEEIDDAYQSCKATIF